MTEKRKEAPGTLNNETAVSSPDIGRRFITIGDTQCVVLNDTYYEKVREYFGFEENFVESSFSFDDLTAGGGKGGNPMCQTSDRMFFIKELSSGDHKTLDNTKFAKALCHHIIQPPSLIDPILAHFLNPDNGLHYIAMLNVLRYDGEWEKMYDLKGCADDRLIMDKGVKVPVVRKRFYKLHVWCGCGGANRKIYKDGKLEALHKPHLPINRDDKVVVMEAIERDTAFLTKHNLMDYSLIVGVSKDVNSAADDIVTDIGVYAGKPFVSTVEGEDRVMYIGIIDYLQQWNGSKKVAKAIKMLEHNKATVPPKRYGARFATHFDIVLIAMDENPEDQIARREQRKLPHRCFPCGRQ